jgi:hypothetical protein
MVRSFLSIAVIALAGSIPACEGGGGDRENTDARVVTSCTHEDRATPYSAGMSVTTTSGLKVYLDDSQPSPPTQGKNTWTLRVEDANGARVTDAAIAVVPKMPGHNGHPSPLATKVTSNGDGTYTAKPVDFNMDGYWETTVSVNTETDQAVFPLCMP